jgi:hypothetical protein
VTTPAPASDAHRLHRLAAWARVWLEMVWRLPPADGPSADWVEGALKQRLHRTRAMVRQFIFLRASARPARFGHGHRVAKNGHTARQIFYPKGWRRIAFGGALRRATRGRDLRAQIEALLAVFFARPRSSHFTSRAPPAARLRNPIRFAIDRGALTAHAFAAQMSGALNSS